MGHKSMGRTQEEMFDLLAKCWVIGERVLLGRAAVPDSRAAAMARSFAGLRNGEPREVLQMLIGLE